VFLFPGQGQQFAGMAGALYLGDAKFRARIDEGLTLLPGTMPGPFWLRFRKAGQIRTLGPGLAQPLLFLTEYALANALEWILA